MFANSSYQSVAMIESSLLPSGPTIFDCRWLSGGAFWWGWDREFKYRTRDYQDFFYALLVAICLASVATLLVMISIPLR